jgi:electron transfer flavoprotein beta subunit
MVKIVPDVDKFQFDLESNTVVRENVRMIINPDDVSGVGFALRIKSLRPETTVEVVTMAPHSARPLLNDLVKVGVDHVTWISDRVFSGSDSYATSRILSEYLKTASFDCIVTGTHAIDGDTSHVPSQLGELLELPQMSHIILIDENKFTESKAVFTVEDELSTSTYELELPGILSIQKESNYKMPYIKLKDINRDVSDRINIISNSELQLGPEEIGLKGSLTKVKRTFVKEYKKRDKHIVQNDEQGIETVYLFLKSKGFV